MNFLLLFLLVVVYRIIIFYQFFRLIFIFFLTCVENWLKILSRLLPVRLIKKLIGLDVLYIAFLGDNQMLIIDKEDRLNLINLLILKVQFFLKTQIKLKNITLPGQMTLPNWLDSNHRVNIDTYIGKCLKTFIFWKFDTGLR